MRFLSLTAFVLILAGCADGSALVTGTARAPIADYTTVAVLTEMPEGAENIAIVKASSDSGWNQQQSLDYAVEELKKQAAKVGANAVIITNRDTATQTSGYGDTISSSEVEIVEAVAVYVAQ